MLIIETRTPATEERVAGDWHSDGLGDGPVEVEHGEQLWRMPSGAAAYRAALAIDAGEDVESKLAALGGVRLA